jgi:outer membrane protein assembly factor BamD (BamD/ComL family)
MKRALVVLGSLMIFALVCMVSCGQKVTEEQLNAKIMDFQDKQQWQDAATAYEKLIKSFPKSPKADENLYNLGMVFANNLKMHQKAIDAWKRLLKEYPSSRLIINTKFMIAYCYANDIKDLDKAGEAYKAFLKEYPNHELAPSVQWELDHLGQDISDIDLNLGDGQATAK